MNREPHDQGAGRMCDYLAAPSSREAKLLAWRRTIEFFRKYLV
jgi:hypothetical protein